MWRMAMADYWIKWYIEILDDPKMATLPDRLWRRFSELCLISARLFPDKSGKLPDVRQLAWVLRMSVEDVHLDLDQLSSTGMIEPIPNGWVVVNFTKRQAAVPGNERVKQFREREKKQQYYEDVTHLKRSVTESRAETESETESEKNTPSPSFSPSETASLINQFNEGATYRTLERVYAKTTMQTCIPPNQHEMATKMLQAILDTVNGDEVKAIEECKKDFSAWCGTVGKNGRNYGALNTNWMTKTLERLVAKPATSKQMSDLERAIASMSQ
jgi:hypothetical protein